MVQKSYALLFFGANFLFSKNPIAFNFEFNSIGYNLKILLALILHILT
jgi:hypothetical protein